MILGECGKIRVHWWTHAPNFGDVMAPWLVSKLSGRDVEYAAQGEPAYLVIGSILSHVSDNTVVWGVGSFGTETPEELARKAEYLAVRGPLTRNKLVTAGINCPRIYGDPALLAPLVYAPPAEVEHELGIVLRWSERKIYEKIDIPGVKKILLRRDDVEAVIDEMRSCRRIATSSLHGLIVSDAYGIPNAWIDSDTPVGREFKYWDYLISVDKVRQPATCDLLRPGLALQTLMQELSFDSRAHKLDLAPLLDVMPFKDAKARGPDTASRT
jgi:hypothetical protein